MKSNNNVSVSYHDPVPAWLINVTLLHTGERFHTLQGELFLRGEKQHFQLLPQCVTQLFREWQVNEPVTIQANNLAIGSNQPLNLLSLEATNHGVPLGVAKNLFLMKELSIDQVTTVENLINLMMKIRPVLQKFLIDLFSDSSIASAFVTLPSSSRHHHAWPGGLLAHSVESAKIAYDICHSRLNSMETDISTVAVLLHDIGKTKTLDKHKFPGLGHLVAHETVGLELLSPHLTQLEKQWPHGANILRHMLSWDKRRTDFSPFPGTMLIRFCDQFDTSLELRQQSFTGKPNYYHYTQFDGPCQQQFTRIPDPASHG